MSEQRPHFPKRVRPAVVGLLGRLNYTAFLRHGTFQDATTGVPFPDDAQEIVRRAGVAEWAAVEARLHATGDEPRARLVEHVRQEIRNPASAGSLAATAYARRVEKRRAKASSADAGAPGSE